MAAPTEIYVDPAINANSGTGTIGDPYGDLQYALNTASRDTTNGNRINIKAGTDEVMSSAISLATFGTPGSTSPLIFQGYTSAAGDGGIGGISGGGSVAIFSAASHYTHFVDLHLHNCGAADILTIGNAMVANCEFDNTTGNGLSQGNAIGLVLGCNFHNISGNGVNKSSTGPIQVIRNYFKNGANSFNAAINTNQQLSAVGNIISVSGASDGIVNPSYFNLIERNSIFSNGGTGQGIRAGGAGIAGYVLSNLIEGFSGSGGVGIEVFDELNCLGSNAVYNCATNYALSDDVMVQLLDNETLGSSPFAKSGSDTFANRATYFAPLDVGNVWSGAYPGGLGLDKGAVQHAATGGSGGGRPRIGVDLIR